MDEIWSAVVGMDATHEVSNMGRVRTIARSYAGGRKRLCGDRSVMKIRQRILDPYMGPRGYLLVSMCANRRSNVRVLHRVVAETFIGPAPSPRHQVNHVDGNKLNNRVDNLEWCTPQENSQHAYDMGLKQPSQGMAHGRAKLTDENVREIRKLLREGLSQRKIAKRFGVASPQINRISLRKAWSHLE